MSSWHARGSGRGMIPRQAGIAPAGSTGAPPVPPPPGRGQAEPARCDIGPAVTGPLSHRAGQGGPDRAGGSGPGQARKGTIRAFRPAGRSPGPGTPHAQVVPERFLFAPNCQRSWSSARPSGNARFLYAGRCIKIQAGGVRYSADSDVGRPLVKRLSPLRSFGRRHHCASCVGARSAGSAHGLGDDQGLAFQSRPIDVHRDYTTRTEPSQVLQAITQTIA